MENGVANRIIQRVIIALQLRTHANGRGEERAVISTRETITEKMRIWLHTMPRWRLMRAENFLWE